MNHNPLLASVMERRKAAGLLVTIDRESPALNEQIGRFTYFAKDAADRDAFIARAAARGLRPEIVCEGV